MRIRCHRNLRSYAILGFGLCSLLYISSWMRLTRSARNHRDIPLKADNVESSVFGQRSNSKILCWVIVQENNLHTKGEAVNNTWARRCDKTVFFSSKFNSSFPTIPLSLPEGREFLTVKSIKASVYAYETYGQEYDWFLKADDDTYVIVENLRRLLQPLDPDKPLYLGYRFKPYIPQGYMSGGAGYVISQKALKLLVVKGIQKKVCRKKIDSEDLYIGLCLNTLGVKTIDTLDREGLETFHPLNFVLYFDNIRRFPDWMFTYPHNPLRMGFRCCSNYTISFHYISPADMYLLDFLIYYLRH